MSDCCSCFTDSSPLADALALVPRRGDLPREVELSVVPDAEEEGAMEGEVPIEADAALPVVAAGSGIEGAVWAKAVPAERRAIAAMSFFGFMW